MVFNLLAVLFAGVEINSANVEIVLDRKAPAAAVFAAKELKTFLDGSLGAQTEIVNELGGAKKQIVVGENGWSRAAGIDLEGKKRDTFVIKEHEGRIYIAGRDSNSDIARLIECGRPTDLRSLMRAERATASS